MTINIAVLSPNKRIGDRARDIAEELGMADAVSIHEGHLSVARDVAALLEAKGAEVLVARGTSAEVIMRSPVRTPVVEIPVSGQDLAKALRDAKDLTGLPHPRIALLAFASIQRDLEVFADLLGINLVIYDIQGDLALIGPQVLRAKAEGADVVVAGSVTSLLAQECGMLTAQLDSGEVSLRTALLEAQKVVYARRLEKKQTERFRAVMETSRDGILVVDAQGEILAANQAVRRILRLAFSPEGRQVEDVLPVPDILTYINGDSPLLDEILPDPESSLLLSVTPTRAGGRMTGAVIVLQPSTVISALDTKIRKSLFGKGLVSQYDFSDIRGNSPQIRATLEQAKRFAATSATALITGETGTGKELLAQAIHNASACRQGPFVAVNCAALPPALLESELFGYEEGAFTGAKRRGKSGMFELAHGGTIFLDEISELDGYGQVRLLRVLQERRIMRLGGDRSIPVEIRVIAATNKDLHQEVLAGRFRKDLYFRLNILRIPLPPLRERRGDILFLAKRFAEINGEKYGRSLVFSVEVQARLEKYSWPGNVRELATVIERLALTAKTRTPTLEETLSCLEPDQPAPSRNGKTGEKNTGEERGRILEALSGADGSISVAAARLGIHRTTLHRKMRLYGLRRSVTGA